MDDRKALLLAWLEGEGERQRRPVLLLTQANDPALRGRVHVGICALGAALLAALFVCWLHTGWNRAMQVTFMEELRLEYFLKATGDPNRPALPPAWWRGGEGTARTQAGAIAVFLCVMVFATAFGTVIGAVFLRAACALYNQLAGGSGSPSSVPQPLQAKAMGITFVTTLVNAVAGLGIGLLVGASGAAVGAGQRGSVVIVQLLSLPVSLLVMASMSSALLPTTFVRGFLVALCYLLVVLLVVVVLAVIYGALFWVVSLLR